ncbi:hypothetical protein BGZ88_008604 [Linnemannia elongata]|uniref:Uncharacterized protein n=1 Tax=Linnemannia elongata AG-77 TaxID=1314771 RepID=A0A197K7B2_9FUNG|nr:hypothetical protein BGZ88_008604 [Linnemannia elongata]KAG0068560.1 hypothetical protein BGZ89_004490 [Linnemannia elongata]OAQ32324.1 hypothetical protein K457DRAFT_16330 [Linnemannia elongata AG-77]
MLGLLGLGTGQVSSATTTTTTTPFFGLFRVFSVEPVRFTYQALYQSFAKGLFRPLPLVLVAVVAFILFDFDFEVIWDDDDDDLGGDNNQRWEDPADFDRLNVF